MTGPDGTKAIRRGGSEDQTNRVLGESVEHTAVPSGIGLDLLQRELTSDLFPGVGPATACKLREAFGDGLHAALADHHPEVANVVGDGLAAVLAEGYPGVLAKLDLIQWLSEIGVETRVADRIVRCWGDVGAKRVKENPYLLLPILGWPGCEHLKDQLGIEEHDPRRLIAAVEAVLEAELSKGHTWTAEQQVLRGVLGLLRDVPSTEKAPVLACLDRGSVYTRGGFQPPGACEMERVIAQDLAGRLDRGKQTDLLARDIQQTTVERALEAAERDQGFPLSNTQREAVMGLLKASVGILAGYAGTGKTTTLRATTRVLEMAGRKVVLCALSGRAARRISEATGRPAYTIATTLKRLRDGAFKLAPGDLLVVDEASMVDLPSLYALVRLLPAGVRILLTGDPAQLPPIGPGRPFHDLIEHEAIPRAVLTDVRRQAAGSGIPEIAEAVRYGRLPILQPFEGLKAGVSFVPCTAADAIRQITRIGAELRRAGVDRSDIQTISPIRAGDAGVDAVNRHFHSLRREKSGSRTFPGRGDIAENDPVIFTRNDYDRDLQNGSMGRFIRRNGHEAECVFDGRNVALTRFDAADVELAYAISVHKSQGSAWRVVFLPVFNNRLLDRTLIYTGITRATDQVVIFGDSNALSRAVLNQSAVSGRRSALVQKFEEALTDLGIRCDSQYGAQG